MTSKTNHFDLIIAGAGLAGLSLAYHISQKSALRNKKILLVDRELKQKNDRTWSFWQKDTGIFDDLVCKEWGFVDFMSPTYTKILDIAPYSYKMIRGADFYAFMNDFIANNANITTVYGEITAMEQSNDTASVCVNNEIYTADYICSSINATPPQQPNKQYILQHFKGYVIHTPTPAFDISRATLMDFSVAQHGDCRFVYVLPTDAHTAMVEYTVFSETLLADDFYDAQLKDYIANTLKIKDYEIQHTEFGVIPMTDAVFPTQTGKRIFHVGTAGGNTRASTGYTYTNIQKNCAAFAHHWAKNGTLKSYKTINNKRFAYYDSVFLSVLSGRSLPMRDVFSDLFKHNTPQRVLRFLDGDTNFADELKIMSSVPILTFLPLAVRNLLK